MGGGPSARTGGVVGTSAEELVRDKALVATTVEGHRPLTQRRRPIETLRKARTITGSKWVPADAVSSRRAAEALAAFL